ncbi:MAG: entericidin A/B family lipoprotein [Candidatus Hydrogenedentes bacterium]|nr:entericidin A/B family lipoprotein [Candidatus Hydrogenedentota bacterium]
MIRSIRWFLIVLAAATICAGCNTVRGMGKDIQRAGERIQESVR